MIQIVDNLWIGDRLVLFGEEKIHEKDTPPYIKYYRKEYSKFMRRILRAVGISLEQDFYMWCKYH